MWPSIIFGIVTLGFVSTAAYLLWKSVVTREWVYLAPAFMFSAFAFLTGSMGYLESPVKQAEFSERLKQQQIARAVQDAQDAVPRQTGQIDGCVIYAFKNTGQWHYFTRCPAQTTTDTTYTTTRRVGKRTVVDKHIDSITTQNQ